MTPVLIVKKDGPLYSKLAQRQGCQVPIALVISLCKCVTSKKALIYLDAYAIRARSTFKALLFNLHHHRPYSKPHNIFSSPPKLAYISIRLVHLGLVYLSCVNNCLKRKSGRVLRARDLAEGSYVLCYICIYSNL